jgi:hypothetical protein
VRDKREQCNVQRAPRRTQRCAVPRSAAQCSALRRVVRTTVEHGCGTRHATRRALRKSK